MDTQETGSNFTVIGRSTVIAAATWVSASGLVAQQMGTDGPFSNFRERIGIVLALDWVDGTAGANRHT